MSWRESEFKQTLQHLTYQTLKAPALEQLLMLAYESTQGPARTWVQRFFPQPWSYDEQERRVVERHGLHWELHPFHYFQWHHYYKLPDPVAILLRRLATGQDVLIDVGANIGMYGIMMGYCAPNAQVFCFEPQPETYQQLTRHLELNDVPNVSLVKKGLGSELARVPMFDHAEGDRGKFSLRGYEGATSELFVEVTTLDAFLGERGLGSLDVLKVDVEGLEPEVFRGGQEALEEHQPALCVEYSPAWYEASEPLGWLEEMGYEFYRVRLVVGTADVCLHPIRLSDATRQINVLGIHRDDAATRARVADWMEV